MTNYSRGANFERQIMDELRELGYFCVRSAGSHGSVDVLAFRDDTEPWFIQAKLNGILSMADSNDLRELCECLGAIPIKACRAKGKGQRDNPIRYMRLLPNLEWDEVRP